MKKAEITSQIFIYIMVLIVGGGILLFGYKAIAHFTSTADETMMIKFTNDFKNDIKTLSYGQQKSETYYVPSFVKQICFKGRSLPADEAQSYVQDEISYQSGRNKDYSYVQIENSISQDLKENVYFYPKGTPFFSGKDIDLDEASRQPPVRRSETLEFACFDVIGGSFKIVMNGQGSSVLLTESK
ncbi:hypothetical protein JXB27_00820 [Candidatus Woesearchaeota archaeon]|nr:hypothetical protein [Candidatus Woesearchaeota archaeon]